ncbi:MAG TPA: DUF2254 domain-containing protein [Gemmatimonadaceae bacterium]|nr:DUF2254 domain-containing protein [Gemmatimonadaceae bacterium]
MTRRSRQPLPGSPRHVLLWARILDSLWFIPALGASVGVILAVVTLAFPVADKLEGSWIHPILFSGELESARAVLGTIAGSLITVTGVVFSVTIVTLQLASTQFTPRVMRGFIADRTNQSVLAIFIGTFTYTLLVLGGLGSPGLGDDGVPVIAVTLSLVLLLISVGALILFINRSARSVQVSTILRREAEQALDRDDGIFPAGVGVGIPDADFVRPAGDAAPVRARGPGYVQAVDGGGLLKLAQRQDVLVEMKVSLGEFLFSDKVLLKVWPAERMNDELHGKLLDLLVIGPERTPQQDVEFSIGAVADVAIRALSTGINDPTTAMLAIDRLTEILRSLAGTGEPAVRADESGAPRLIVRSTTFERAAGLSFDQIRLHGGGNPAIVKKILDSMLDLLPLLNAREAAAFRREADHFLSAARRGCPPEELPDIEDLALRVLRESSANQTS